MRTMRTSVQTADSTMRDHVKVLNLLKNVYRFLQKKLFFQCAKERKMTKINKTNPRQLIRL